MKIPRAAMMILCLAAGFGVSLAWHRTAWTEWVPEPRVEDALPSRRVLQLENLWSERRGTLVGSESVPLVLAAVASGKWDAHSKKEAVSLLIADPSFINTIWTKADPQTRTALMGELMKNMAKDCPPALLKLVDKADFDLSQIPNIGEALNRTVYGTPVHALETLMRNKAKLGAEAFGEVLLTCSYYEESSRVILTNAATGKDYPERVLENAFSQVILKDGELAPGVASLEAAKKYLSKKEAADSTTAWLKGDKEFSTEQLKSMDGKGVGEALFTRVWDEGGSVTAGQLEQLTALGQDDESAVLDLLVESGRSAEAIRLLEETKDMPATKAKRDELIASVASSIYGTGGNVGEACELLQGITDDPLYWKSMTEILTVWAKEDPQSGREYLEKVTDPELRQTLEATINAASLK